MGKEKRIPFDLERYKLGDFIRIETREFGYKVNLICTLIVNNKFTIIYIIKNVKYGYEEVCYCDANGRSEGPDKESCSDLFLIVEENIEDAEFDIRPFDTVLVRNSDDSKWKAETLYEYCIDDEYTFVCSGRIAWLQCVPYNENTKKLLESIQPAPEEYRWWWKKEEETK